MVSWPASMVRWTVDDETVKLPRNATGVWLTNRFATPAILWAMAIPFQGLKDEKLAATCSIAANDLGRKRASEADLRTNDCGVGANSVLQPELRQHREDAQLIDQIRRVQHVDSVPS